MSIGSCSRCVWEPLRCAGTTTCSSLPLVLSISHEYLASKVRQRPTVDSACSWQMLAVVSADSITLMPPATAVLDSCSSSPASGLSTS